MHENNFSVPTTGDLLSNCVLCDIPTATFNMNRGRKSKPLPVVKSRTKPVSSEESDEEFLDKTELMFLDHRVRNLPGTLLRKQENRSYGDTVNKKHA